MAIEKEELIRWLNTLHDGAMVGVDDGGLILVCKEEDAHLEVGGLNTDLPAPDELRMQLCIPPDTKIRTEGGVVPIGDLIGGSQGTGPFSCPTISQPPFEYNPATFFAELNVDPFSDVVPTWVEGVVRSIFSEMDPSDYSVFVDPELTDVAVLFCLGYGTDDGFHAETGFMAAADIPNGGFCASLLPEAVENFRKLSTEEQCHAIHEMGTEAFESTGVGIMADVYHQLRPEGKVAGFFVRKNADGTRQSLLVDLMPLVSKMVAEQSSIH